jgi:hypothetical protein
VNEEGGGKNLCLVFCRLVCADPGEGRGARFTYMPEPRHTSMHYGMTQLMRQGHSISTNAYLRAVSDTALDGDRYGAVRVFGFGIDCSKLLVIDNDEDKLLSAV